MQTSTSLSTAHIQREQSTAPHIDKLCLAAIKEGASDIHITPGCKPQLRIKGELVSLDTVIIDEQSAKQIFDSMASDSAKIDLSTNGDADFALSVKIAKEPFVFRVNAVKSLHGISITMRLVSNKIPTPQDIGLSNEIIQKIEHGTGLFLATGATGSGKSTTLAALVQWLANKNDLKIITVEQPIEYRFAHGKGQVVQREVPNHARSFADTLRSTLRSDPDVIMIGELRDLEEIRLALKAAESGHLVLSTIHTNSASDSIDRLINVFPGNEQSLIRTMLSNSLLGVISQDLLPKADKSGRILAYEVMFNNSAISNHIRQEQSHRINSTLQTSAKEGMHTFDSHVLQLLNAGVITRETALTHARKPEDLAKDILKSTRPGS